LPSKVLELLFERDKMCFSGCVTNFDCSGKVSIFLLQDIFFEPFAIITPTLVNLSTHPAKLCLEYSMWKSLKLAGIENQHGFRTGQNKQPQIITVLGIL